MSVHRGPDGLRSLEPDWRRLTAQDQRYWTSYAWVEESLLHGATDPQTAAFHALHAPTGEVLAIVPLAPHVATIRRVRFSGRQVMGSAGDDIAFLASGTDFPAVSREAATEALGAVRSYLRCLPDPPSVLMVGRCARDSFALSAALTLDRTDCPDVQFGGWKWLDVDRPFTVIQATLSGKFKISLRSCRRNLAAMGKLEFGCTRPADASFTADFDDFLHIEASGWKGTSGTRSGLLVNPVANQREFLEALTQRNGDLAAELHWLKLDGQSIASQLWFRYRSTRAAVKVGYDERYSRYQPGHLLLEHVVRESCEDPGLRQIDFVSAMEWLDKWRVSLSPHYYHYVSVRPGRGLLADLLLILPRLDGTKAWLSTVRGRGE